VNQPLGERLECDQPDGNDEVSPAPLASRQTRSQRNRERAPDQPRRGVARERARDVTQAHLTAWVAARYRAWVCAQRTDRAHGSDYGDTRAVDKRGVSV
jgi:hypothetical protein